MDADPPPPPPVLRRNTSVAHSACSQVRLLEFQAPINSAHVTALAFALAALGEPSLTTERVFLESDTPMRRSMDRSGTLAELHAIALALLDDGAGARAALSLELTHLDDESDDDDDDGGDDDGDGGGGDGSVE